MRGRERRSMRACVRERERGGDRGGYKTKTKEAGNGEERVDGGVGGCQTKRREGRGQEGGREWTSPSKRGRWVTMKGGREGDGRCVYQGGVHQFEEKLEPHKKNASMTAAEKKEEGGEKQRLHTNKLTSMHACKYACIHA